jgi:hypothetical protein
MEVSEEACGKMYRFLLEKKGTLPFMEKKGTLPFMDAAIAELDDVVEEVCENGS